MGQTQIAKIEFGGSEDQSASELGGAQPTVLNAIMDKMGVARRRPVLATWSTWPTTMPVGYGSTGEAIIGMCPFGEQVVFVTNDRKLHALSSVGGIAELSSSTSTTMLDGDKRPVFLAGRNILLVAGGGAIQKWTGTGLSARLTNTATADPVPEATSICGVGQRLVVQLPNKSGLIAWSGPLEDYENWDFTTTGYAGYLQASAKPDPLQITKDNTNEVFAFGSETLQVFAPSELTVDGVESQNTLPFAPARTTNLGTVSPYSVEAVDDMFMFLDRLRRAVLTDGRSYQDLSGPVASILRAMESVADCWAFRMKFGRFDAVVWVFPTDGYGLVYDSALGSWCEWREWSAGEKDISIASACNWPEQSVFLVGTTDGSIVKLDDTANTDLGNPVPIELVSGFQTHGTMAQKHCRTLMLQFKRTWTETATSGWVRVSYRDDQGAWHRLDDIELSASASPCVQIRSIGVYRTRQWKVRYTGSDEIQLVGAQEEFEILGA